MSWVMKVWLLVSSAVAIQSTQGRLDAPMPGPELAPTVAVRPLNPLPGLDPWLRVWRTVPGALCRTVQLVPLVPGTPRAGFLMFQGDIHLAIMVCIVTTLAHGFRTLRDCSKIERRFHSSGARR